MRSSLALPLWLSLSAPAAAGPAFDELAALAQEQPAPPATPAPAPAPAAAPAAPPQKMNPALRQRAESLAPGETVSVMIVLDIPRLRVPPSFSPEQRQRARDTHFERHSQEVRDYLRAQGAAPRDLRSMGVLTATVTAEQLAALNALPSVRALEANQEVRAYR